MVSLARVLIAGMLLLGLASNLSVTQWTAVPDPVIHGSLGLFCETSKEAEMVLRVSKGATIPKVIAALPQVNLLMKKEACVFIVQPLIQLHKPVKTIKTTVIGGMRWSIDEVHITGMYILAYPHTVLVPQDIKRYTYHSLGRLPGTRI